MRQTKMKTKGPLYDRAIDFAATVIVVALAFFFSALVFVAGWDWVAVPLFHAAPSPYSAGLGCALIVSYFVAVIELFKERK
jgi:hypothetical protein